jgi:hypothetical protein
MCSSSHAARAAMRSLAPSSVREAVLDPCTRHPGEGELLPEQHVLSFDEGDAFK